MIPTLFFLTGLVASALLLSVTKTILLVWLLALHMSLMAAGVIWAFWGFGFSVIVLQVYLSGLLVLFAYFVTLGLHELIWGLPVKVRFVQGVGGVVLGLGVVFLGVRWRMPARSFIAVIKLPREITEWWDRPLLIRVLAVHLLVCLVAVVKVTSQFRGGVRPFD